MFNDEELELSTIEREALAALPREMVPGDLLEERVVRALRAEGHLGSARLPVRGRFGSAWKVASAVALFAGGIATGRYSRASDTRQSAAAPVTSPAVESNAPARVRDAAPRRQVETVVAEREMWL
jgi:hypothetical protein